MRFFQLMSTPGYSFMKQIDFRSGQTVTVTERHLQWVEIISESPFFIHFHKEMFNPNWHEAGHFYPPCNFGIGFCPNSFGGEN